MAVWLLILTSLRTRLETWRDDRLFQLWRDEWRLRRGY